MNRVKVAALVLGLFATFAVKADDGKTIAKVNNIINPKKCNLQSNKASCVKGDNILSLAFDKHKSRYVLTLRKPYGVDLNNATFVVETGYCIDKDGNAYYLEYDGAPVIDNYLRLELKPKYNNTYLTEPISAKCLMPVLNYMYVIAK